MWWMKKSMTDDLAMLTLWGSGGLGRFSSINRGRWGWVGGGRGGGVGVWSGGGGGGGIHVSGMKRDWNDYRYRWLPSIRLVYKCQLSVLILEGKTRNQEAAVQGQFIWESSFFCLSALVVRTWRSASLPEFSTQLHWMQTLTPDLRKWSHVPRKSYIQLYHKDLYGCSLVSRSSLLPKF